MKFYIFIENEIPSVKQTDIVFRWDEQKLVAVKYATNFFN